MHRDFKELLSAFNAARVKYLIVGGYAVSFHAQPRATKDLDILIGADTENSKSVYMALAKFGAPIEGLSAEDFTEPGNCFRMGSPPVMVDIMPKISGIEFEQAWQRRVDVQISDDLTVPFISLQDLMVAKIAAGRGQDLIDVDSLRECMEQQEVKERRPDPPVMNTAEELDQIKKKRREHWLRLREEQQRTSPTPEALRAKKREDWLKLRQQRNSENSQEPQKSPIQGERDVEFKDSLPTPNREIDDNFTL